MKKFVIYGLSCACHPQKGTRYVGQTRVGLSSRLSGHRADANRGRKVPIARWICKHGPRNIVISPLEFVDTPEHLNVAEMDWISNLRERGLQLLNVGPGGDAVYTGSKRPEHAARMTGPGNPMYGVDRSAIMEHARSFQGPPSERTRLIWSENRKGAGNSNAKLSEADVRRIREKFSPSRGALTKLAREYGVSLRTIRLIVDRKTWVDTI